MHFRPAGYRFTQAYKKGFWDGYITLTERDSDGSVLIPTGLIWHLKEQLGPSARLLEVDWKHASVSHEYYCYPNANVRVELDDVQEDAITKALDVPMGIVHYPTGVGKGRIMGQIIARLNAPFLVLVDKKDLLTQVGKEISASIGEDCGTIGDGMWDVQGCTIATVQTIARALNLPDQLAAKMREAKKEGKAWSHFPPMIAEAADARVAMQRVLAEFAGVIVDEAHHAESDQFQTVLNEMSHVGWRYGMSATPFRSYAGRGKDMGTYLKVQAVLGPPIASLTISDAINTGRIVRPTIFMVELKPKLFKHSDGRPLNYSEEVKHYITESTERNDLIVAMGRRLPHTIILTDRTEHGAYLAQRLGCPFIQGSTPSNQRDSLYSGFRQGIVERMVISKLANEGLDLPNMENLILAGGGKASHVKTQQIGRAMRAVEGKDGAQVFDFMDNGKYLSAHSRRRLRAYHREAAYHVVDVTEDDLRAMMKMPV